MDATQVVEKLEREVDKAGGQRAWASANGLSAAYVNAVLHGRREPADAICKALGLVRIIEYTIRYVKYRKQRR